MMRDGKAWNARMHELCIMMVTWQWVRELVKGFSEFQVGIKLTTPVVPGGGSNH